MRCSARHMDRPLTALLVEIGYKHINNIVLGCLCYIYLLTPSMTDIFVVTVVCVVKLLFSAQLLTIVVVTVGPRSDKSI